MPLAERIDVRNFVGLARQIARRYTYALGGDAAEAESAAFLALAQCSIDFDPSVGTFSTYFVTACHHTLQRELERHQRRTGVARQDRYSAKLAPVPKARAMAHSFALVSLDAPIRTGEDDAPTLSDFVADDSAPDPEATLARKQDAAAAAHKIANALSVLNDRERRVIVACHLADERMSLKAVGVELGIGRERTRQIEAAAFDRLRRAIEGRRQRPGFTPRPQLSPPPTVDELARLSPRERRIAEARLFPDSPIPLRQLAAELGVSKQFACNIAGRVLAKIIAWRAAGDPAATPEPASAIEAA
jgi:RNA polymerase sigma factor (sigma-70 family)